MIPEIAIFVRHSEDCPHKDDELYKKCHCRKHLRWTWEGKQYRRSAKTRSWATSEQERHKLAAQYEESGQPAEDNKPTTIEQAIAAFTAEKSGGQKSGNTLAKYKLTLSRLLGYCAKQNLIFMREITLAHLSAYRAEWNKVYSTAFALRNEQSRIRAFFTYCTNAQMISFNPAKALSPIKVTDEDFKVDPFTEAEVNKILKAIDKTDMTPANKEKVRTLMLLQRWSGLSLVDAVCLSRDELKQLGKNFRVDTSRRKTGTNVSVPIPSWLGQQLLQVKNGNAEYFFQSGQATTKSATSIYDKLYRKVFQQSGVPNASSHRFRHRFAVALLESGVDIRVVSKALGHKSLAVTERHYAAWSTKQQAKMEKEIAMAWK